MWFPLCSSSPMSKLFINGKKVFYEWKLFINGKKVFYEWPSG